MPSMSYCRFQNTDNELSYCVDALEELQNDPNAEPLSHSEAHAAEALIEKCLNIVQMLSEHVEVDGDDLINGFNTRKLIKQYVNELNRRT
jgi:hypothetical protein